MTRTAAHTLLDAARAGADIDPERIRWALRETGDLAHRPQRVYSAAGTCERDWVPSPDAMRRAGPFDAVVGVSA